MIDSDTYHHTPPPASDKKPPFRIGLALNLYSLVIAVVPITVVVLIALNLFSAETRDQAVNQMSSLSLVKSREIDRWGDTSKTTLALVLANSDQYRRMVDLLLTPGRTGTAGRNVTNFLTSQLALQDAYDEFFLYNLQGEIRISTIEERVGQNLAELAQPYLERSFIPTPRTIDETRISPVLHPAFFDPFSGEVTIIVTQPLLNETGDSVGVLAGKLSIQTLAEIMGTREGLGETGETYLVSPQYSNLITPSRFEPYDPTLSYVSEGIDAGFRGVPGSGFYRSYRDVEVIGVYRWLPELESALIAEISEDEALDTVRDVRNISILVAAITGVIVLIIGQGLTQWITRPISKLTRVAQAVMSGDYTQRANISVISEIGHLSQAFDTMTTELVHTINERNVRIKQIEELSETLESRVNARTRDLQVAAIVARQITTVLDIHEMLQQVVSLTVMSFDLYVCLVFTYDEDQQALSLSAGVNADGEEIRLGTLSSIPIDARPSIIADSARSLQTVVDNDVLKSDIYLAHSELPDTRSELAIPLILGNRLLGILDIQSREPDRFSEEDINVLQTLAEQISVAIRNAQLFAETQDARAEAEQANQVKSQFLASMSHELRTPLNAILNFTEFVADGVLGEVNAEQVDALNKAIESGEHLLSLINDILDLTKIEVGMMELFIEEVDLNKQLESVLSTGKGLVSEKPQLRITTDIQENLPVIAGDKRRLRQIMLNLISNAVKYTPEGNIHVRMWAENGGVMLSVRDTGVGIHPDEQQLIFERFRQAERGLSSGSGTGLGLPITRHLVEAHGGDIWLESEVNVGTTFYVRLPVRELETPAQ